MKKYLLLFLGCFFAYAINAQQIYETGSNYPGSYYRYSSMGQTSSVLTSQARIFDDVNVTSTLVGNGAVDSFSITKLQLGIVRLAGAPATTMNVWYAPMDGTVTTYAGLLKVSDVKHVASYSLEAQTTSASKLITLGDSIHTLFKVKVDTGVLFYNHASFFIGVSFQDTTGSAWFLGDGAGTNDDVFWKNVPTAGTPVVASWFNGNPVATFFIVAYGNTTATPMPITMEHFSASKTSAGNKLTWTTSSENNNTGFEIQRSADGKEFSSYTFIKTKAIEGNSNSTLSYEFIDNKPLKSSNYYRLKQIDKDGKYSYSNTVVVKEDATNKFELVNVYPNPAKDKLSVSVTAPKAANTSLIITDMTGKTVMQLNNSLVAGENNIAINVASLRAGNYIIKLSCAEGCESSTQKFIKQ